MLTARCQEPSCSWELSGSDPKAIDEERDRHFMTHPWDRDSGLAMPRFPALSDDTQGVRSSVDGLSDIGAAYGATLFSRALGDDR